MHHPLRRAAGAAAIAAAAALALPGMASAFSSCSYDAVTKRVAVSDGSGDDGRLQVTQSGQFVAIRDLPMVGAGTQPIQLCTNGSVAATVTNTDRVVVQGRSRGGSDDYVLSMMGPGATEELDGFSELEIQVQQQNSIGATLTISGTPGNDTIKAGGANLVMLGPDSDIDINEFAAGGGSLSTGQIELFGNGGNDFLSGRGGYPSSFPPQATVPVQLFGGNGNDTLVDGLNADFVHGEGGNDTFFSVDNARDLVNDSAGSDFATFDVRDDVDSDIEGRQLGTVGRLQLAPKVVHARPGAVAHVSIGWRHPVAWRNLRSIRWSVYAGDNTRIGSVTASPRTGKLTASGAIRLAAGSKLTHRGKTATAKLAVRLPGATGPLRVDVDAVDRDGRRQVEPGAGTIILRRA
jgi:hypothetical protein